MNPLPTSPAFMLKEVKDEKKWLIEHLWNDEGVGIIGGEPKCCKSYLALSLAVSVATGIDCLNKYKVIKTGRVVLYAAEDALHIVRKRLEGISNSLGSDFCKLDIQVITSPTLRLDLREDRERLNLTIKELQPKLLILDPFVRLHRIDENSSGEVAPILANLRELQRKYHISIIIVHHAKKGGTKLRAGQALRGSSEFHAWGDVNLYMRRDPTEGLNLSIENRSYQSQHGIPVELVTDTDDIVLKVSDKTIVTTIPVSLPIEEKIINLLMENKIPISSSHIREKIGKRSSTVGQALQNLVANGKIKKNLLGYQLNYSQFTLQRLGTGTGTGNS